MTLFQFPIFVCLLLFFVISSTVTAAPAIGEDKSKPVKQVVRLASLSWPPYADSALAEQGASVAVAKAAFAAEGIELIVSFYPWTRAVHLAEIETDTYAGYFPEYYSPQQARQFIYSDPIGSGPLGLVETLDKPILWQALADLKPYTIGVVKDYINTEEFDEMVANNEIATSQALSDRSNVLKVAYQRVPVAIIDRNVLYYLMKTDDDVKEISSLVQFNQKLLARKKFYVCFNKQNKELVAIFNRGLMKVNAEAIQAEYLKGHQLDFQPGLLQKK